MPTTAQQLGARTKTPEKSLLIVPWHWSDRRNSEPEHVCSLNATRLPSLLDIFVPAAWASVTTLGLVLPVPGEGQPVLTNWLSSRPLSQSLFSSFSNQERTLSKGLFLLKGVWEGRSGAGSIIP